MSRKYTETLKKIYSNQTTSKQQDNQNNKNTN